MKGLGVTSIVVVSLVSVALVGCGSGEVAEREPVVRPVKTMVVGDDQGERLSFPGTVQAADRAEGSRRHVT